MLSRMEIGFHCCKPPDTQLWNDFQLELKVSLCKPYHTLLTWLPDTGAKLCITPTSIVPQQI